MILLNVTLECFFFQIYSLQRPQLLSPAGQGRCKMAAIFCFLFLILQNLYPFCILAVLVLYSILFFLDQKAVSFLFLTIDRAFRSY